MNCGLTLSFGVFLCTILMFRARLKLDDRQLPMNLPFMTEREDGMGSGSHPSRYDMSGKRYILISTCGFYSAEKKL